MKILLTAFEPFGGLDTNSSLEVFKRIERDYLIKKTLPVSYDRAVKILKGYIDEYNPDFVINFGQAGGETSLRVEKVALNYTRASIADNDGDLRKNGEVISGAPFALKTKLDVENLVDNFQGKDLKSYLSLSAGGYICNTTYYASLFYNNGEALFIHFPYYKGQKIGNKPSISLEILQNNAENLLDSIYKIKI